MRSSYAKYSTIPSALEQRLATVRSSRLTLISLVFAALAGCMSSMLPPGNLDYARVRASVSGRYRAAIKPDGDSIPQGKLQQWTLHLETVTGSPIDNATVTVDGGMPQHGHGLPTKLLVTRHLGNGDHLVEGMKFNMGGWWVVKFHVNTTAGVDSVEFNLKL